MTATLKPGSAPASPRTEPVPDTSEDLVDEGRAVVSLPRPTLVPLRALQDEDLEARARRRRTRLTITVAAGLVALSLLGVVAINVMISQDQLRIDRLDAQRDAALARHGDLQLKVTQLQAPARIVGEAEQRLGMVVPPKLTYLSGSGAPIQTTGGGAPPAPLAPPPPPPPPQAPQPQPQPPPTPTPAPPASGTTQPAAGTAPAGGSPTPAGQPGAAPTR
jgi:cell division protein FtsL